MLHICMHYLLKKAINTIVKVLSAGYKLKDRVIRPAMVVVARKKEVKETNENVSENKENNSPKD